MMHVRLKIELTLIGPVLTQATSAGRLGLDAVMARTADDRPYLPYSQVRGKLRQALEELADEHGAPEQQVIARLLPFWLGRRRGDNDADNERGALCLSDFVHPLPKPVGATTTRIQIDEGTGTAQDKKMLVIDKPFEVGEEATFEGEVRCVCDSSNQAKETVKSVVAGLKWIRQIGAERTTGYGRVKHVTVREIAITELAEPVGPQDAERQRLFAESQALPKPVYLRRPAGPTPAGTRFALRIRPRGPFCITGPRHDNNLFESESVIPGGAILGALATTWAAASGTPAGTPVAPRPNGRWNHLAANFTKLTVTHALPCPRGSSARPCAIPLSLAAAEPWEPTIPDTLYDVALCTRPRSIPHGDSTRPPVFQPDWKSHAVAKRAKAVFGWSDVPKDLRIRTSIDAETLRAADNELFGYQMIMPDKHEWLGFLELRDVPEPDRASVLSELRQLLAAGLGPLGKTKVDADIEFLDGSAIHPRFGSSVKPLLGNRWVITLQSPAVLCGPSALADPTGTELHEGYQETFSQLHDAHQKALDKSGSALKLLRFFAKQSLAAPRFAGRLPRDEHGVYYPFVLTEAGSTFVLEAGGDVKLAQAQIEEWLVTGLPVPEPLLSGKPGDPDWQRCPYLHRHGYGEIAVNPPWLSNPQTAETPRRLEDEIP